MSKKNKKRNKRSKRNVNTKPDATSQDTPKASFNIEALEPRILLSTTWVGATAGDDVFDGTNDADIAHGLDGHDELHGGNDDDQLFGGDGNDTLYGDNHSDLLDGGAGDDMLFGGNHDDTLISGGGNDFMDGGKHDDTFQFTGAQDGDVITVDGGQHDDTIDLSDYSNSHVSDSGSSISVDMGGGQSFTVNYSNVENVKTSEGTYATGHINGSSDDDGGDDHGGSGGSDDGDDDHGGSGGSGDGDDDHGGSGGSGDGDDDHGESGGSGDGDDDHGGSGGSGDGDDDHGESGGSGDGDDDHGGSGGSGDGDDDHGGSGGSGDGDDDHGGSGGSGDGDDDHGESGDSDDDGDSNANPNAVDDNVSTTEDSAITTGNVLSNDTDADGDALSVTGFTQGSNGSVADNGDGTFTYTPNANFNGNDSFTYTVDDGNGGTDTATINVNVDAANDGPDAVDDSISTTEDSAITTGNVLSNDTDADGDALSVTGFTQGSNGSVADNGDGTFTYTPNANYNGNDSFTYTVDDGNGGTDTATINVNVDAANDGPDAHHAEDQSLPEHIESGKVVDTPMDKAGENDETDSPFTTESNQEVGADFMSITEPSESNEPAPVEAETLVADNSSSDMTSDTGVEANSAGKHGDAGTRISADGANGIEWSQADLDELDVIEGTSDSGGEVEYAPSPQEILDHNINDVPHVHVSDSQLETQYETLETIELPAISNDKDMASSADLSQTLSAGTFDQAFEATGDVDFAGRNLSATLEGEAESDTDTDETEQQHEVSSFHEATTSEDLHEASAENASVENLHVGFLAQMWGALRGLGMRNQKMSDKKK